MAQYSANDLKTLPFSLAAEGQETLLYGQVWPAEYATKKDGTINYKKWLCNLCADGNNRKDAERTFRREGSDDIKACHCCLPKEARDETKSAYRCRLDIYERSLEAQETGI